MKIATGPLTTVESLLFSILNVALELMPSCPYNKEHGNGIRITKFTITTTKKRIKENLETHGIISPIITSTFNQD